MIPLRYLVKIFIILSYHSCFKPKYGLFMLNFQDIDQDCQIPGEHTRSLLKWNISPCQNRVTFMCWINKSKWKHSRIYSCVCLFVIISKCLYERGTISTAADWSGSTELSHFPVIKSFFLYFFLVCFSINNWTLAEVRFYSKYCSSVHFREKLFVAE